MTDHISKHTTGLIGKVSTSTNSKPFDRKLDDGRVKRIFALMQSEYGTAWLSKVGSGDALRLAFDRWAKVLAGLTDEQIQHGFENLPEEFPPGPTKFKNICEGMKAGLTHNTAAYKPFDRKKALELKPDKAKARAALSEIRQTLARTQP